MIVKYELSDCQNHLAHFTFCQNLLQASNSGVIKEIHLSAAASIAVPDS